MELGRRIRHLRKSQNLTQDQLVDGLFDRSYLSQIETGKIIPPLSTIQLLSERFGVPISEIITDEFNHRQSMNMNKSLIEIVDKTSDTSIIKQAWDASRQLGSIQNMCRCIIAWYRVSELDFEYMHSLLETVEFGMTQESFCDEYWEALLLLGNTYFRKRRFEEALHEYKRLLGFYPPIAVQYRVLVNLGSTWLELHNYGEAHLAFSKALTYSVKHDSTLGRIHQGLGISSRKLNLLKEAITHTKIASEIFVNHHDITRHKYTKVNMAVLFLDIGHLKDAYTLLEECFDFFDEHSDRDALSKISEEFARYYFYIQEYKLALKWADVGLDFVANDYNIVSRLLAWKTLSYIKINNVSNALECIRHLKAIKGKDFDQTLLTVDPNMNQELRRGVKFLIEEVATDSVLTTSRQRTNSRTFSP